jgi:lipoate---protein ligase
LSGAVSAAPWSQVDLVDAPAALHGAELPLDARGLWWLHPTAPGIVLGSAQPGASIDRTAAARLGVDVARRRSGGGAVLVMPGEVLWLDVTIPRHDALWDDDIGRSMWWLGEVWQRAFTAVGVETAVHRGPVVRSEWSAVVCFAGLGAGEVTSAGGKLVGISQRRTRDGARLQSMCHLVWRPAMVAELCGLGDAAGDALADIVDVAAVPADELRTAFVAALHADHD